MLLSSSTSVPSWSTWDTIIVEFFNSGFNGAIPAEWGNLILMILSLGLGALFSGLIGFEREYKGHDAGLRTHLLVSVGSDLIMIISIYGFGNWVGTRDPSRLAAQVVTGVGFLGAGAILNNGLDVKGLTTAATIWVSMAIGLACGSGNFILATLAFLLAFIALIVLHKVDKWIAGKNPSVMIILPSDKPSLKEIIMIAARYNISIRDTYTELVSHQENSAIRITLRCASASKETVTAFTDELRFTLKPLELKVTA